MSLYTLSGLSKPFSCCGHWDRCRMGQDSDRCYYKDRDPETMLNCRAYQRNRKNIKEIELDNAFALFDKLYGRHSI